MTFKIEAYSDVSYGLGEGPHYLAETKQLYFVDIINGLAATIDQNKKVQVLLKVDDHLTAVLPVASAQNQAPDVVVSIGTELYLVDVKSGQKTLLDSLGKEGVRFNDAKCDPRGRLFIGTMGLEQAPGILDPEKGALYLRQSGGKLVEVMDQVSLSNGLCWALDGKTMYYIDSFKRLIYSFGYDVETGKIDNRKVLVNMNEDDGFVSGELPDGMTIDIKGNIWVAMFNGGRIVNIDGKTGKIIESIEMPTSMITSVCFGGQNLDELYVTSCKHFLDEERKAKQPLAGYIFKVTSESRSDFKGFQANFNLKL